MVIRILEVEMQIGICAWVLPVDVMESFSVVSQLGLEGLVIDYEEELRADSLDWSARCELYRENSAKYKVEIPTLALNQLCNKGMTQKSNEGYAKELLHHSIETAAKIGASKIQVPSFYDNLIRSEADLQQTIDLLKYACEVGERKGIYIGSESVMTINEHKAVYEAVKSKALMTLFDTQNPWRMMNQDGLRIGAYMLPNVGELHAKDSRDHGSKSLQLGQGDVSYKEIMDLFVKAGYNDWIQLESAYNQMDDYEARIKKDIQLIKRSFINRR